MEIGVYTFAELRSDPGTGMAISPAQRLRDLLEEIELADQVGLDVFGVGEHHRPDRRLRSGSRARGRRAAHPAHPSDERGHRAQL